MTSKLQIEVTTSKKELLYWDVLPSPVAILWFKLLAKEASRRNLLHFRYSGLENNRSNLDYFINSMNAVLKLISPYFDEKPFHLENRLISREELNELHHIFEKNYGSIDNETEEYKSASLEIQASLCSLNHLIHDYETWDKSNRGESSFFSIIGEFKDPKRIKVPELFEMDFTLNPIPGSMVLHYGLVGKQWHEVFADQDDVIPREAILPLTLASGEFDIFFADQIFDLSQLEELKKFLSDKAAGRDLNELKLGVLPLATPVEQRNLREWRSFFSNNKITSIKLLSEDAIVAELNIERDYESPFTNLLKIPPSE